MKVKRSQVNSLTGTSPHGTGANTCTSVHETGRHLLGQTCSTHARGTTRKHSFAAERLTSCAMGSGPPGRPPRGRAVREEAGVARRRGQPLALFLLRRREPSAGIPSYSLSFWLHCRDPDKSLTVSVPQFSDLCNGGALAQCHECKSSRTVFSFIPVYASGPRDHIPALIRQSLGLRNSAWAS